MNQSTEHTMEKLAEKGANPVVAIAVAIGIALALVGVTFTMFLKSGAYTTVKNIQANSQTVNGVLSDYDTTSPVKAVDIEEALKSIKSDITGLDNQMDYSPDQLSDKSLGL